MSKATTIAYIVERVFQNTANLVTGTKAQEAILRVVTDSVNQDDYDTDKLNIDNAIAEIDQDVEELQTDVAQAIEDIDANTTQIASNTSAIASLQSGGVTKSVMRTQTGAFEIEVDEGELVFNLVAITASPGEATSIQIQAMDVGSNLYDIVPEQALDLNVNVFNVQHVGYTPASPGPAYTMNLQVTISGTSADIHYLTASNYV